MQNYPDLLEKIKLRRKHLGLKQEDLAEISGVSLRTVKSIESNKGNPNILTLLKVIETLGMEIEIKIVEKE
ncbi:MAG: helix-turn-helix domain-containing protein [Bacteroidetes bacterium]|nr:helix-turn-helix domain-containing protein [Bacteroidota bacterium]MBU1113895.1 helix-turn-helix domain-containing protein [Bacteroidota bacterium]MBU1798079.1 helix-turn-helix domain-containing protein [Bacteroidota bacterium]